MKHFNLKIKIHDNLMDKKDNVGRIYLSVPYQKKDQAKELGAKWDAVDKKWFMPVSLFTENWENA